MTKVRFLFGFQDVVQKRRRDKPNVPGEDGESGFLTMNRKKQKKDDVIF